MSDIDDAIAAAEKRGYGKGYAAGQRRAEREDRRREIALQQERFRRDVFCAALKGVLENGTWKTGDKRWTSIDDHVKGAWEFADEAVKGTWFS